MKRGGPLKRKTALKSTKPMPRQSAKRRAYLASPERAAGKAHMERVAQLPCFVCGCYGVEVHHIPDPRSDMRVMPLCPRHHRREYGVGAFHYSKRAFYALHGSPEFLLAWVDAQLVNDTGF